jgi:hypothetical protein
MRGQQEGHAVVNDDLRRDERDGDEHGGKRQGRPAHPPAKERRDLVACKDRGGRNGH